MSGEFEITAHEKQGLAFAYLSRLTQTIWYTLAYFITISGVSLLVILGSINLGPEQAGLAFLSLIGLSLYAGQMKIKGVIDGSYEDVSKITKFLLSVAGILYYNFILALAISFGLAFETHGFPNIAILFTMLLPIADLELSRRFWYLSIAGWVGNIALRVGEGVTWAHVQFPTKEIAVSINKLLQTTTQSMILITQSRVHWLISILNWLRNHVTIPSPFQRMRISSKNQRRLG